MKIFKTFLGSSPTKKEIQEKAAEGMMYYAKRDFKSSAKSFEQYFEMKKKGNFSELDKFDAEMLMNLGNALQYSSNFMEAISIYKTISKLTPEWDAAYLMNSICQYKLGNIMEAKVQWELAKRFGNEFAQNSFETGVQQFK